MAKISGFEILELQSLRATVVPCWKKSH